MGRIFVTSDLHFGHDREFIYKPRGFSSIQEHDEAIIERWNSIVRPEDEVYVLGDLMLGDNAHGIECLNRLNGYILFVHGNHDTGVRAELYSENKCTDLGYAFYFKYKGYHFYMSHYPTFTANLEKESLKQCTINLFGHTHQQSNFYNDIPFMYHVGVDSHDCRPVLLDNALEEMKAKVIECQNFL